jgi:hypothetical protein
MPTGESTAIMPADSVAIGGAPVEQQVAATPAESPEKCRCCPDDSAGLERGEGGHLVGRDPRMMNHAELEALGHKPMSPLAALRARCVDCCNNSASEVRLCTATKCPSWPFRMGSSPYRAPASEAQREAGRRMGLKTAAARAAASSKLGSGEKSP